MDNDSLEQVIIDHFRHVASRGPKNSPASPSSVCWMKVPEAKSSRSCSNNLGMFASKRSKLSYQIPIPQSLAPHPVHYRAHLIDGVVIAGIMSAGELLDVAVQVLRATLSD